MIWIYTCSTNPGKMVEFELIAEEACLAGYQIAPLPELREIKAPEETGGTFEANAELKAQYYSRFTSEMVLADDSGLQVSALGGAPGIYSARYGGADATDEQNNDLLLANMAGVADRRACFVCVIAIAQAGKTLHLARGTVEGEFTHLPQGQRRIRLRSLVLLSAFSCFLRRIDARTEADCQPSRQCFAPDCKPSRDSMKFR